MNEFDASDVRKACIARLEKYFHCSLERPVKRVRSNLASPDGLTRVVLRLSKFHKEKNYYWLQFDETNKSFLMDPRAKKSHVALGCGSAETLLLIPIQKMAKWLDGLNSDPRRKLWYVEIHQEAHELVLHGKPGVKKQRVTCYLKWPGAE